MADGSPDEDGSKTTVLDRRNALKLLGATAVGTLATGTATGSEDGDALAIDAGDGVATYSIGTTGDVERTVSSGDVSDSISEGRIEGEVSEGVAGYRVYGDLTTVELDGAETLAFGQSGDALLPDPPHEIVVTSPTEVSYELHTSGEIEKVLDGGKLAAEDANDVVTQNDDGTWIAEGYTGNGYGDTFAFRGEVLGFDPLDADATITLDGEEMTPYELVDAEPPEQEFVVTSPTEVAYEFTVTEGASKILGDGRYSAEDTNDTVTDNGDGTYTVEGYTGNGYGDSFLVSGEVVSFSPLNGDATLMLGGSETTPYDIFGYEGQATAEADVIGGGRGYADTVPPSAADVTVTSASELVSALGDASNGDVVYVDPDADVYMGSREEVWVPRGVTLASNRGVDGAPGGRIHTDRETWPMFLLADGARVTGLRIEGPYDSYAEYDPGVGMGLRTRGIGVEIDNNEIQGFSHAAVRAIADCHVHHNHVHHNPMDGLGYGVSCTTGHPLIECNYMNYNRHSVASSGAGGYTVVNNHFGPDAIDHVVDMHRPGGNTMIVKHNTVEATTHVQDGGVPEAVAVRGVPGDVSEITDNWFHNANEPGSTPDGWSTTAITQVHTDDWESVSFEGNHYGSGEPADDVGCPR